MAQSGRLIGIGPNALDFDARVSNKAIYNKPDQCRHHAQPDGEPGIKDKDGQLPGKTIARHATTSMPLLLQERCSRPIPPSWGSSARQVVRQLHDPRAEQLIDDFKGDGKTTTSPSSLSRRICLDTGIGIAQSGQSGVRQAARSRCSFSWRDDRARHPAVQIDPFGPGKPQRRSSASSIAEGVFGLFPEQEPGRGGTPPQQYNSPSSARRPGCSRLGRSPQSLPAMLVLQLCAPEHHADDESALMRWNDRSISAQ